MGASGVTLVVGGTGFLGYPVVTALLQRSERVRVLTRQPEKHGRLQELGAELLTGDLLDAEAVRAACAGSDRLVAAAHSFLGRGRHSSAEVDGAAHERLIEAARAAGVKRVVYLSVLGASATHAVPFWRYKAQTEEYLRRSGVPHSILRPSAFMDFHAEVLIGKPIFEGRPVVVFGPGNNPRNFVAAQDVAAFVLLGLKADRPMHETIELGGPEDLSSRDVARCYESLWGRAATIRRLPLVAVRPLQRVVSLVHPGVGQLLSSAIDSETSKQTFDASELQGKYGIRPIAFRDWMRLPGRLGVASAQAVRTGSVEPARQPH